jgi:hypothetical protein
MKEQTMVMQWDHLEEMTSLADALDLQSIQQ